MRSYLRRKLDKSPRNERNVSFDDSDDEMQIDEQDHQEEQEQNVISNTFRKLSKKFNLDMKMKNFAKAKLEIDSMNIESIKKFFRGGFNNDDKDQIFVNHNPSQFSNHNPSNMIPNNSNNRSNKMDIENDHPHQSTSPFEKKGNLKSFFQQSKLAYDHHIKKETHTRKNVMHSKPQQKNNFQSIFQKPLNLTPTNLKQQARKPIENAQNHIYGFFRNHKQSKVMRQKRKSLAEPYRQKIMYNNFLTQQPESNTKNSGFWSAEEHARFVQGYNTLGRKWSAIAEKFVKSRTRRQVISHAQKYLSKFKRSS